MVRECSKCKTECLAHETVVVCEGFCIGIHRFHARCVGLSDEEGDVCMHKNILWMCDDCRDLIEDIRFRETVNTVRSLSCPVETEVEKLKSDVLKMSDTINTLVEKIANVSGDACTSSTTAGRPISVSQQSSIVNTPPLSSTRIFSSLPACSDAATLKLHLSNIAIDVSQDEVVQMITDTIGVKEIINIKCLKPAWRDASTMDFISFKVEIADCHRQSALNSSKWPEGIRYREFRDFTNTTWRPAR